jgi:MurNAc alpha-1-phosphate uridylyltransferase
MTSLLPAHSTAFILAAGKGERMRPLTEYTPKPLLKVGPYRLIEYHLFALAKAGFQDVVINIAYLSEQFPQILGDGSRYGLTIYYSDESKLPALETAGGIINALGLIKSQQFLLINGDVFCDCNYEKLLEMDETAPDALAKIVLVDNPVHNPDGDFGINSDGLLQEKTPENTAFTYSGIGLFNKSFFRPYIPENSNELTALGLGKVLRETMRTQKIAAQKYEGKWFDIGTPERLSQLDKLLSADQ